MNRRKLPGVASATKRLADGTLRKYFYAWRGGPLLRTDDGTPLQPGDPEFHVAYAKAHADRKKPAPGTLFTLIATYRASSDFPTNEKTASDYRRYLRLVEDEFGTMPLAAVVDIRARGKFKAWRDTMAANPRKADYAWSVLLRVLSFAKDRGMIAVNVCERGGRLYEADRTEIIWTADDIKKFCAVASGPLKFALLLALWTGQRQADLIRLTWMQYGDAKIRLQQGKGKKRVTIPVGEYLKAVLDAHRPEKPEGAILRNTYGKPWTIDGFKTSWGKAVVRAGLADKDLHFHDLRGTAVTRLAIAGCTVTEIAAITGHSLQDIEAILDAHYLGGKVELAEQAIIKLNARYGNGT
ncbi:MAG: tyrosine-type recombinase/integrase [Bradyrhizobiaceae bacterium]|nr:tyrosine-type recombinase/integrase [Bradyrhizobiaceae bacterium]